MIFKKKSHIAAIEMWIEEAKQRPQSADTLNYIGDLYLRKGDKASAVAYYHDAVSKVHISQQDRIIAIYKKIININPSDDEACIGLINMFSRLGLTADEISYLELLSKIYEKSGDVRKLNTVFRKLHAIDPQNRLANKFFSKGKVLPDEVSHELPILEVTPAPSGQEDGSGTPQADIPEQAHVQAGHGPGDVEKELLPEVPVPEENPSATLGKAAPRFRMPEFIGDRRLYFYGGAVLICVGILAAVYALWGRYHPISSVGRAKTPALIGPAELTSGNYEIGVEVLSKEQVIEMGLPETPENKDLANIFFVVALRPKTGCLPEAVVSSPGVEVGLIDRKGRVAKANEMRGLPELKKVIRKANVCGEDRFDPIYERIVIAGKKGEDYVGLSIKGLAGEEPVTVKWR